MTAVVRENPDSTARRLARRCVPSPHARWTLSIVGLLAKKSFQTRFKRSFLGVLWLVIQPTLQALVIAFVVVRVFKAATVEAYPLFVLSGTVPWSFTQQAVLTATTSVVDNGALVRKVRVPPLVYPASAVAGYVLAYIAPLGVVVAVCLAYRQASWAVLLLPFVVALNALLVLAIGTLAAGVFVTYRDMRNLIQAVFALAFYATPILYDTSQLPDWAKLLVRLNPMTGVLELYRFVFLGNPADVPSVIVTCAVAPLLLGVSAALFRRNAGEFADLV